MLKFNEHLTDSTVGNTTKKLFTDAAINELKDLVEDNTPKQILDHKETIKQIIVPQEKLDIVTPAKVVKVEPKFDKKNLFSLPSIVTALFFVLSTVYVDYDAALEDGRISRRERLKLIYLLAGAVSVLVSRATEGKSQAYVPKWLPGPHLTDLDGDGDIDLDDQRIYNSKDL